jgi:hypothetical protein
MLVQLCSKCQNDTAIGDNAAASDDDFGAIHDGNTVGSSGGAVDDKDVDTFDNDGAAIIDTDNVTVIVCASDDAVGAGLEYDDDDDDDSAVDDDYDDENAVCVAAAAADDDV